MAAYTSLGCEFQVETTVGSGTFTAVAQLEGLPNITLSVTSVSQQILNSGTALKVVTGSELQSASFTVVMDWSNTQHQFFITEALTSTKTTYNGKLRFAKGSGAFAVINFTFQVGSAFPTADAGQMQKMPVTIEPQSIGTITF